MFRSTIKFGFFLFGAIGFLGCSKDVIDPEMEQTLVPFDTVTYVNILDSLSNADSLSIDFFSAGALTTTMRLTFLYGYQVGTAKFYSYQDNKFISTRYEFNDHYFEDQEFIEFQFEDTLDNDQSLNIVTSKIEHTSSYNPVAIYGHAFIFGSKIQYYIGNADSAIIRTHMN